MTSRMEDCARIHRMLQVYFDALYQADAEKLHDVFCEDGIYVSTTEGDYLNRTIPDYMAVVAGREAPAIRGEQRREEVISVEFGGPDMAFVRLNMSMMNRWYTDFLTLYRREGNWKIMAKIFAFKEGSEPCPM